MKYYIKSIVIVITILLMLTGCANKSKKTDSRGIKEYLEAITENEFNRLNDEKKTSIVYVRRSTCEDCQLFEDRFIEDIKKNKKYWKIKYLDVNKLHSNDEKWRKFKRKNTISGTPAFLYFKNGKLINVYSWTEEKGFDYEKFKNWIEKIL